MRDIHTYSYGLRYKLLIYIWCQCIWLFRFEINNAQFLLAYICKWGTEIKHCFCLDSHIPIFNRPVKPGLLNKHRRHSLIHSLTHSASDPLWKYLKNLITPKPLKLGTWNFETMFTTPCLSHVLCPVSLFTCYMSGVRCQVIGVTKKNIRK